MLQTKAMIRRLKLLIRLIGRGDFRGLTRALSLALLTAFDGGMFKKIFRLNRRASTPRRLVRVRTTPPKVSVVVPNYNHAPYLAKRLESIYNQTYKNIEVILLDDCSTDNSREILTAFAALYPKITKTVFNETNAGSQNRQWAKGISLCTGSLVWIAESDDFCELDFLEKLVPHFEDESVLLAYSRTVFVNENDAAFWSTEEYLANLGKERWLKPYVNAAADEAKNYFSRKNLICNASSALFRRPIHLSLLQDSSWLNLKICADWIFYLNVMRGGAIAYTNATTNYYRRHKTNLSVPTYSKDFYYREHQIVGETLARLYDIDDAAIDGLYNKAMGDWFANCSDKDFKNFENLFDKHAVSACRKEYKPNIAICSYAFTSGGGETLPIHLANALKRRGYSITFINFDLGDRIDGIRNLLSADIPVINLVDTLVTDKIVAARAAIQAFHLDVIHSHYRRIDQLINRYCSDLNFKHVVTLHGSYELLADHKLEKTLDALDKSVSAWVYVAKKNLSPFIKSGHYVESKFFKIDNALESRSTGKVTRGELGLPDSAFVACLASRAIPEKGWREAIQAVNLARKISQKDIHLLLIGEGPLYDELKNENLARHIRLLGFRENVPEHFHLSDLGLLPSCFSGESFPLVLVECLLAGRPAIASDIGEIRDMLTCTDSEIADRAHSEIAGTVFSLENGRVPIQKLAEILADYASNPTLLADKTRVVKVVAAKFNIDQMAERYEKVYCQ